MASKICFTDFDPLVGDSPGYCDLCLHRPPIFKYQCSGGLKKEQRRYLLGYCCLACSRQLLERLRRNEARHWAEEEAAFTEDKIDIAALRRRRVEAFGDR